MAPPNRKHQIIAGELFTAINNYIKLKNGICEPDISVICDKSKLTDKGCSGAPDWIIEIVSYGSRRMDCFTKLFKYRTAGVKEYWIVDPEKNRILVYNFKAEDTGDYTFSDSIKVNIYDDLLINFSNIANLLNI